MCIPFSGLFRPDCTDPRLYEDIDGITVDSAKFLLTGETESGCRLMVNGQEQLLGEDGVFRVELSLKNGENTIEIQATDPSGNQTRQQAVLFRERLRRRKKRSLALLSLPEDTDRCF